jgi:hypothetical protein
MTVHRVNIDFEFELFDPNYNPMEKKNRQFCREYEFVYFFLESNKLKLATDRVYDKDYINYLENILTKEICLRSYTLEASPWWGNNVNKDLEKKLNSKETSYLVSKKLGLLPKDCYYLNDISDLPDLEQKHKYLIKNPFLMSGRGQQKYEDSEQLVFPCLIEPFHEVKSDYGFRIHPDDGISYCVKLRHIGGKQFSGGEIVDPPTDCNLSRLLQIAKAYQKLGCPDSIQIDCYSYQDQFRYCVEANHRKTMGDFINSIQKRFDPKRKGRGLYVENQVFKTFSEMEDFLGDKLYRNLESRGIIPCSPPGNLKTWFYEVE